MSGAGRPLPSEQFKALLADPALRDRFLPPMTDEEIGAVQRLLDPVVADVEAWCARWAQVFPLGTIPPVCLQGIVQYPHWPPEAIALRARVVQWAYALDDLFDEGRLPTAALMAQADECLYVASSPAIHLRTLSPWSEALLDLKSSLSRHSLYQEIHAVWCSSLARVIDGMIYEYWMQKRNIAGHAERMPHSLDEYLSFASSSIAINLVWMTGLIIEDDPSAVTVLRELSLLATQCGAALRLANDICSFQRELREGRSNAVSILLTSSSDDARVEDEQLAIVRARQLLSQARLAAVTIATGISTASHTEGRFLRGMDFAIQMYERLDLREWSNWRAAAAGGHGARSAGRRRSE